MNLAINGFGRIGRIALRIIQNEHPDINVVLINDLTDAEVLAHLFEFDSTYGRHDCGGACFKDGMLATKYGKVRTTMEKDPANLPHKEMDVDVVLECTGVFRHREDAAKHLEAGAKKVILSAPGKDKIDGTFCVGVNDDQYDPATMDIISNASCTTNCLAPMAKVLNDAFGITYGYMTTIHSYTNDQRLLDLPHKDKRRARCAPQNIILTTTGAAKTLASVLPELEGKLDGMAVRVPTPTGSVTDLTVVVEKETSAEKINEAFKKASESGPMAQILDYEERPLVLQDYVGDPHSCIIDALSTKVTHGTLVKILGWYDNEWGYACRLVDMAKIVGSKL